MQNAESHPKNFPYVITVSSEKGGVGKTTLATNLAVFIKALHEDIPVSILSFDNHFTIDKMFTIRTVPDAKTVANLLSGEKASDLLQTGQYGVNFIPSSSNLAREKNRIKSPMDVARYIAASDIPGILIIDTRPDLETLTENALYAADRVLIPVKDMPSLENCKNIFSLFDKRGLDKKSLVLVPCLIDERIKFDGLFIDQKTLLRAFAINRGYRCHDVYISKSPKVESLNTNPDGKIYPILTHGRGTDVHGQFIALAKEILAEHSSTKETRSLLFHKWMCSEDEREKEAFIARMGGVRRGCLLCGQDILGSAPTGVGYYFETSDGSEAGFLDNDCFLRLLSHAVFNLKGEFKTDDPTFLLLAESARNSLFAFKVTDNLLQSQVDFIRMDAGGLVLTKRTLDFSENPPVDVTGHLSRLIRETLAGYGNSYRNAFLTVHPVNPDFPGEILQKEQYKRFNAMKAKAAAAFT